MNTENLSNLLTVLIARQAEILARQEVTMRQLALLKVALTKDGQYDEFLAELQRDYEHVLHSHQFAMQKDLQRLRKGQRAGLDWIDPDPDVGDPDR